MFGPTGCFHHKWGRMCILSDHLVTLDLHGVGLTDDAISKWPPKLPIAYLSLACNHLTGVRIEELL